MFFKTYAVASLLAGVIGSPITDTTASFKLAKRSEGIHLVNCEEGSNYIYSAVVYCANDSDCDFNPASGNECIPNGGGVTVWEGFPESCEFSTGITFSWDIESNAKSQPYFSQVGSGNNGYTEFNIFNDDDPVMYTDGNGYECKSIYYCLDA